MNSLTISAPVATQKAPVPVIERAVRYIHTIDPSIQGQLGSDQALWAMGCLTWGFLLDGETAVKVFTDHFNPRCLPPWPESEIRHKCAESIRKPPNKPRGWLLKGSSHKQGQARQAPSKPKQKPASPEVIHDRVISFLDGFRITEQEAMAVSTVTFPEPSPIGQANLQAMTYMEALYDNLDMINIITKSKQVGDRWVPSGWGHSYPVNVWQEEGIKVQPSKGGSWIGVNTFDDMGVCNENVSGFPYVLVEHDNLPRDLQLSFLFKLGETAPLVAVIDTGGKSLHGIFKVSDVHSLDSYNRTLGVLYARLEWAGIDRNCKTASRRTRLPGAMRGDRRQCLLYLSPEGTLAGKGGL